MKLFAILITVLGFCNSIVAQVRFETTDLALKRLYDSAEKKSFANISGFGKYKVLVEGPGYPCVWLETQPMGGEMYAKRDVQVGLNNQVIFMAHQREDGRLPGRIRNEEGKIVPDYGWIQGFCFPSPALNMYYWGNRDKVYLNKLYDCLVRFDAYLWRARDSDGDGCLESWCVYDTGEDNSVRLAGAPLEWTYEYAPAVGPVPIESMDFMSYSYSARAVLAEIAVLLNNGKAEEWKEKARSVRAKIKSYLWDPVKLACYDRDAQNKTMDILLQNNIRCMYYGSFDQQMADDFIAKHLFNPKEFWTPMPLPSISVNDPKFRNVMGNNWSGQSQGLTFQRCITALENYGHFMEVGLLGKKLIEVLKREQKFAQQYDPFTGKAGSTDDGYGPTVLSLLEYISRMYGIHYVKDRVWWSSLNAGGENLSYEQVIHGKRYTQIIDKGKLTALIDGKQVFAGSANVRVVTDLKGKVLEVVGIDSVMRKTTLSCSGSPKAVDVTVKPNEIYKLGQMPGGLLSKLESGFLQIPDTIQTSVYWYWVSDNISKEGVVKDLEAMKRVGINRAFIGNIGIDDMPFGKVKMFTETWWEIMHTALKTATRLGIEIGVFNSPGWSQSGGPWVKPAQSMRYLASSEVRVKGSVLFDKVLTKPEGDFQDVKVIAYPAPKDAGLAKEFVNPVLVPGDSVSFTLELETGGNFTVRSLSIWPALQKIKAKVVLEVKEKNGYRALKTFEIDRHHPGLQAGFKPYGEIVIAVPAVTSGTFRLVLTNLQPKYKVLLAKVRLSASPLIERYNEKSLAKMFQDPLPYWSEYQWAAQPVVTDPSLVIDPKSVIDLSGLMDASGRLNWKVPAGDWVIQRLGMLPTGIENAPAPPEGRGLETDKMSKAHIRSHFDAFLGEIIRRVPAEDRKTWKMVVEDSYEMGSQNWTDDMEDKFKLHYGYDPLPYLPVLEGKVVGSADQSNRFLWDLRRFVADRVAYDYVGGLAEVSHEHGLKTWLENYGHGGFPGEFLQYGGQSDEVAGEFWSEGELGDIENRAAASCAHIYGKTKVSAESFTAALDAYQRFPYVMKQRGDKFFAQGINNTLLHLYIQQPDERVPGVNAWFCNEFNRHNTWFEYMGMFTDYLKRSNYMLQQGKYVADVAYFIGEDAPKMTGIGNPELPAGYAFDYINAEVLMSRATVKNGRLMLPDGMNYGLLVLPPLKTMRPEVLAKLNDLVQKGLRILGPAPERSPSLQGFPNADVLIANMAKELWTHPNVLKAADMKTALDRLNIKPDFELRDTSVLYLHRTAEEAEIYYLSNQSEQRINISPVFRIKGLSPEVWDAVSGTTRRLPNFKSVNGRTQVDIRLEPLQSLFIVFRKGSDTASSGNSGVNFPEPISIMNITGPWKVQFDPAMRGPKDPVVFTTLTDWSRSTLDSVKYYSGTAVYHNAFRSAALKPNERVLLNIGKITGMAKVKVNGVAIGGIWAAPWCIDISSALKEGENSVEIAVVNNWVNRLIGDSRLPEAERKTWTIYNEYEPDSPLQSSGLVGVVKIERIKW